MLAEQNVETLQRRRRHQDRRQLRALLQHARATSTPTTAARFEVVHHTELLAGYLATAGSALAAPASGDRDVARACYLGRHNGVYDAPRDVLARWAPTSARCRGTAERSFCCGAGGARMWMEEGGDTRINDDAVRRGGGDRRRHRRGGLPVLLRDAGRRRQGEGLRGPRRGRRDPPRGIGPGRTGALSGTRLAAVDPVLFVRCDAVETFGGARAAAAAAGAPVDVWEAIDPGAPRPDLSTVSGVVVFGSTFNVEHADEQPFIKAVADLTAEAVERDVPSSASASARRCSPGPSAPGSRRRPSARSASSRSGRLAAGAEDPVLGHYEDGAMVFQWHMDAFDLPEGGELLATGDDDADPAIRVGETTWATQFHAEVDAAEAEYWVSRGERGGGPRGDLGEVTRRRSAPRSPSTWPRTRLAAARPSAGSSRSAGALMSDPRYRAARRRGRLPPRRGPGGAMAARRLRRAGAVPRGAPAAGARTAILSPG